ncbi:MAG: circadian clock protein KaiC, partial [Candidatus Diapherotrites archaeon]|nr:circadian clock protein KaiC [Candidatus Diapherotrites archaeon]
DGVLPLFYKPPNRSVFVRKMRGTKHSQKIHPITIDEKGVSIKHKEEIFWESLK